MRLLDRMRKRGISLRILNNIMLVTALVISLILFVAMQITSTIYQETEEITQNLLSWRKTSYDLQIASDYLTEQIRCFVVTGSREYLDNYFKEAKEDKRRENALAELKKHHNGTVAFRDLSDAMEDSMDLMKVEYHAARLAVESYGYDISEYPEEIREVRLTAGEEALDADDKLVSAEELLFGDEYHKAKDSISKHISRCLKYLDNELTNSQLEISGKLSSQVLIEHLLTGLLILITLGIVLLTLYLVMKPLQDCVDKIREEEDIPLRGAYEIRFLAKTYNLMHHTNLQSQEQLTYDATHDNLTGLYNRRGYEFLLKNVDIETSALLLIDLDKFKEINDTYGHDVGDKVLTRVAETIFGSFRSQDYVCRIGGDEMAVIMVHSDASLSKLLNKKVRKINERLRIEEDGVPTITISVGVAFGDDGIDAETLFRMADEALYKAKENGRGIICFHQR